MKREESRQLRKGAILAWGEIVCLEIWSPPSCVPSGHGCASTAAPSGPATESGLSILHGQRTSGPVWCLRVLTWRITHGPRRATLDSFTLGCCHLLRELRRTRPELHVYGHVHGVTAEGGCCCLTGYRAHMRGLSLPVVRHGTSRGVLHAQPVPARYRRKVSTGKRCCGWRTARRRAAKAE